MLSRREILSPLTTPNIPGHIVTPKSNPILSPSTNRHASLQNITPLLTTEHDDEKERKERRRSKIVELQRRNLGSPSSPADRRRSAALNGLTLAQLTDHYTNCIKLSAENKINSKNAFGLHLIDYMSELLKKRELENFQVASSTLDASAKIYAGRVDAIHAETYKVLTGLGRGSERQSDINPEGEEIDGQRHGSLEEENNMKKRKTRKNHTIETNLKNITVSKLELEFEVDPLFQMMSATFDEGGTNGLLLNNLQCYDDTQKLMLDSSSIVSPFESCMDDTEQTCSMDVNEMTDAFTLMKVEDIQICPAFANFKFTDWDGSSDTILNATSVGQSEHAFDLDAEAEPIHQPDGDSQDIYPLEDTEYNDLPDDESVSAEDCHLSDQSVQIGDGRAAQLVQIALKDMTQSSVGSLLQILAEEPSDYSYFNKALVRTWAGPSHWRLGPLSKDQRFKSCDKMMKNKTKKPTFKNDFDEEIDFDKFFKRSKSTTLTKATKSKYSKDQTTLPKDLHYEADKLFRVFRKPNLMIKRQNDNLPVDDEIQNYDYENANDRDNYCPNNFEADDEAGNDDDMENFTQGFGEFTQDTSQDLFSSINPSGLEHDLTLNGTLAGDQLVSQPYKVTKINIAYAKTAKRLDVKRVKTAMWDLLSQSEDANMTKGSTSMETPRKEKNMTETQAFQHLLKELPVKLSDQMARNLSVPIAFVCLLHLANEKTLKILAREDMSDLQISQGI